MVFRNAECMPGLFLGLGLVVEVSDLGAGAAAGGEGFTACTA